MTPDETELASYFAKYEPAMAKFGKAVRAKLLARLPGLTEIVYMYENQKALVISYSPSEHGYEGICSLSLYPDCVKLHFTRGLLLAKSDPKKLLQGAGKGVRHIVLASAADFDRPEIDALLAASLKLANVRLEPGAKSAMILKAESQKQRAARAKKPAKKTAKPAAAKKPAASRAKKAPR